MSSSTLGAIENKNQADTCGSDWLLRKHLFSFSERKHTLIVEWVLMCSCVFRISMSSVGLIGSQFTDGETEIQEI